MSNIRKHAVDPTSRLHLRNAADELLYAEKDDGTPDLSKPMAVNLYGPGSKQYSRANAINQNKLVDKLKRKGKTDQTADERTQENADFLAMCTHSWENVDYEVAEGKPPLQGAELSKAIYSDIEIGFISDQVAAHIKEWANFLSRSTTS